MSDDWAGVDACINLVPCGSGKRIPRKDGPGGSISSAVSGEQRVVIVDESEGGIIEDFWGNDPGVIGTDNKCGLLDAEEVVGQRVLFGEHLPGAARTIGGVLQEGEG